MNEHLTAAQAEINLRESTGIAPQTGDLTTAKVLLAIAHSLDRLTGLFEIFVHHDLIHKTDGFVRLDTNGKQTIDNR